MSPFHIGGGSVGQSLSPTAHAVELRKRATALSGPDRDYYLWLAVEWDKTAARQMTPLLHPGHPAQKIH
jgi:hypothetical protein